MRLGIVLGMTCNCEMTKRETIYNGVLPHFLCVPGEAATGETIDNGV